MGVALGTGARWVREHPARLVAAAAGFALLAMVGPVAWSPTTSDEPQRRPIVAPPVFGEDEPPARATVVLSMAEPDGGEPDAGTGTEPAAEPAQEPGGTREANRGTSVRSPSLEEAPEVTAGMPSEAAPAAQTDPVPSGPEPELSDTGESEDGPAGVPEPEDSPEPTDSPEPENQDEESDTSERVCLGGSALGLTLDLCVPSLLD